VYDPVTAICTCGTLGADVPGAGLCDEFSASVVGGCEVPIPALNTQLALDVFVFVGITSPGAGGAGTVDHRARVRVENGVFDTLGGSLTLDAVNIVIGSTPAGTPATLVNSLDPALAGSILFAFTGGSVVLDLDAEILDATTAFAPAVGSSVDFNLVDFQMQLTLLGQVLVTVDKSMCTFDNPGTILEPGAPPADGAPISCPVRVAP
jgi:hypothetical protein